MASKTGSKAVIGENLRRARQRAGLQQGELADQIGLSRVQANQHEAGRGMTEETLEKYATFYGISVQQLRYGGAAADDLTVADAVAAMDAAWENLLRALAREKVLPAPQVERQD